MAIVRGNEVFAQVVIGAGENSLNRRMHNIEWHRSKDEMILLEGDTLPALVYINTVKNEKGQNVIKARKRAVGESSFLSGGFISKICITFCPFSFFTVLM